MRYPSDVRIAYVSQIVSLNNFCTRKPVVDLPDSLARVCRTIHERAKPHLFHDGLHRNKQTGPAGLRWRGMCRDHSRRCHSAHRNAGFKISPSEASVTRRSDTGEWTTMHSVRHGHLRLHFRYAGDEAGRTSLHPCKAISRRLGSCLLACRFLRFPTSPTLPTLPMLAARAKSVGMSKMRLARGRHNERWRGVGLLMLVCRAFPLSAGCASKRTAVQVADERIPCCPSDLSDRHVR